MLLFGRTGRKYPPPKMVCIVETYISLPCTKIINLKLCCCSKNSKSNSWVASILPSYYKLNPHINNTLPSAVYYFVSLQLISAIVEDKEI